MHYIASLHKINVIEGQMSLALSAKIPFGRNIRELLLQKVVENKLPKR